MLHSPGFASSIALAAAVMLGTACTSTKDNDMSDAVAADSAKVAGEVASAEEHFDDTAGEALEEAVDVDDVGDAVESVEEIESSSAVIEDDSAALSPAAACDKAVVAKSGAAVGNPCQTSADVAKSLKLSKKLKPAH